MEIHRASRASIARLCQEEGVEDAVTAINRRVVRLLDSVASFGGLGLPVDIELVASFARIAKVVDVPGLDTSARVRPELPGGELMIEPGMTKTLRSASACQCCSGSPGGHWLHR